MPLGLILLGCNILVCELDIILFLKIIKSNKILVLKVTILKQFKKIKVYFKF